MGFVGGAGSGRQAEPVARLARPTGRPHISCHAWQALSSGVVFEGAKRQETAVVPAISALDTPGRGLYKPATFPAGGELL
jgi:hypothetical protein